jgi:c(7)-type cytochrome triheme protein
MFDFRAPKITFWRVVLVVIWTLGLYATFVRFTQGLGASTNLSDDFPWGIWIGFDILVGVGLAAGGFVVCATVYIFNLKEYKPIVRSTVLTAFLGYLLVVSALLFDLGRPYRVWHPIIMWNPHSVMFEVGWCVMLYTTVLFLEFSPVILERFAWSKPLRIVRSITIPLVIVGVLLSTLHQSSLGTLYVIAPGKLHPLWYSGLLPIFFFISAIAGGLAMVIFESYLSARAYGKQLEFPILVKLSRIIVVVLSLWLLLRIQELSANNALKYVFEGSRESVFFLAEILLGAIAPIVLLLIPKIRNNMAGLFLSAVLVLIGFVTNRLNVSITGMTRAAGVEYTPSWMEFAITASIVGAGFVLFSVASKYLPVFQSEEAASETAKPVYQPPLIAAGRAGTKAIAALGTLLMVVIIGLGYGYTQKTALLPAVQETGEQTGTAAAELRLPADFYFQTSENSPGKVRFSHENHVKTKKPDCANCHAEMFQIRPAALGVLGSVSMEKLYEGKQCGSCHNGKDSFSIEDGCEICHAPGN